MNPAPILPVLLAAASLLAGCVVYDEVTTLTVHPDGSADLVSFRGNIRSTREGDRGAAQMERYVRDFDGRTHDLFERIAQAGGHIVDARWVQTTLPRASLVTARLPDAPALESFLSAPGENGERQFKTHFEAEGDRRRLTMILSPPPDFQIPDHSTRPQGAWEQERADRISEWRIALSEGSITAARGLTVATDKRSAILSVMQTAQLLRDRPERLELFLEWNITPP